MIGDFLNLYQNETNNSDISAAIEWILNSQPQSLAPCSVLVLILIIFSLIWFSTGWGRHVRPYVEDRY